MTVLSVNAEVVNSTNFSVEIPKAIKVEDIGISNPGETHGMPQNEPTQFNLLVKNSFDGKSWELTTNKPIGVSLSYNSSGTIVAIFVSMTRTNDGYTIPQSDISIYPSKAIFEATKKGGDEKKIFHFNPIIRISKDTPPGNYVGTIVFSVLGR